MTFDLDVTQLAAFATSTAVGASFAGLALQAWLGRRFATLERVVATEDELERVARRLESAPAREDMADTQRRIVQVEVAMGEMRAEVRGVRDGMMRVERLVGLLVANELKESGDGAV